MSVRIGFLCIANPDDPRVLSGMPYAMKRALEDRGVRVVPIYPRSASRFRDHVKSWIPRWIPTSAIRRVWGARPRPAAAGPVGEESVLENAGGLADDLVRQLEGRSLDAIFGCCVSAPLYRLTTALPIVYFSDTTARLINDTYPLYRERGEGYRRACDTLERVALAKADVAIFATEVARNSAVDDYGADHAATHVVPLGVNAINPKTLSLPLPQPPSRDGLRLVMTAADPVRKRSDFAVEVTEILRDRGWNASLDLIGRTTPRAEASDAVRCAGWLDPSSGEQLDTLCRLVAASHLLILPSVGEAFGIAPGEAAHAGRTSIVSAAGGLPEAVLDGETGIVMPLDAEPADYADAIERLLQDPAQYLEFCRRARERAATVLTWDHWGRQVRRLIGDAIDGAPARKDSVPRPSGVL